jgi:hypothetical protein
MENTSFGGFSAGLRHPNQLLAMAESWFSGDGPPYSLNLNFLDFSTGSTVLPKGQDVLTLILQPYVCLSPQNNTGLRRYNSTKHAALSAIAVKPSLRKITLKLNGDG